MNHVEINAMGSWLEGALSALVQMGASLHSFTVHSDDLGVTIRMNDGRVIARRAAVEKTPTTPDVAAKVYLIAASTGHIKIGIAQNVSARLRGLQNAHGEPLALLAECAGGRALEQRLHKTLATYRLKGEWFRRGPWVEALIEGMAANERAHMLVCRVRRAIAT